MRAKKQNQFLSSAIYANIVPEDSVWRKLNELVDWSKWTRKLEPMYKNTHGGNSNYPPTMLLKMLLVQRVYNISDRKLEELCTQNLMVKYFLGLEVSAKSPDYSTVAKFRNLILHTFDAQFYEELFQDILVLLADLGLEIGGTYAVDSTITTADVNTWKDKKRQEDGAPKRDEDASWTVKSRPGKQDNTYKQTYYYGYKSHTIVNLETQLITALIPTTASQHDSQFAYPLVEKARRIAHIDSLTGDAAYDDAFLINRLEEQDDILTAIRIRKTRLTQGPLDNRNKWEEYITDPDRKELLKYRGLVERAYADLKVNHGLGRSKYIGLQKYAMQAYLSAAVMNIKIGFKLLFGSTFHTY